MKGRTYPVEGGFVVRFGRQISKRFRTLEEAERFLTGVRYETDRGTFDPRDYSRHKPLSFSVLADQYLEMKRQKIRPRSFENVSTYISKARAAWGDRNVKAIGFAEIEDFLMGQDVSSKTRSNIKSGLHDFFTWVNRREGIPVPNFPVIDFELGWRPTVDIETQQNIITKVEEIADPINPKIAIGIRWLSTYISVRPGELLSIQEGHINRRDGSIIIPHPKEKRPKVVFLLEDDIEILNRIPEGLPNLYFFRHATTGQRFARHYLWRYWRKACRALGIENVDLYGGTRHSTATALGAKLTPEEIKAGTLHSTNKAFERYFQGEARRAQVAYKAARIVQQTYNQKKPTEPAKVLKIKE